MLVSVKVTVLTNMLFILFLFHYAERTRHKYIGLSFEQYKKTRENSRGDVYHSTLHL